MVTRCHQALLREDQGYSAEANRRNPAVSLLGGVGRDQLGGHLSGVRLVLLLNGPQTYPKAEEDTGVNEFLLVSAQTH